MTSRQRAGLLAVVTLVLYAYPAERYSRPPGPAPRYETAPLAPWTDESASDGTAAERGALDLEIERALAADAGAS